MAKLKVLKQNSEGTIKLCHDEENDNYKIIYFDEGDKKHERVIDWYLEAEEIYIKLEEHYEEKKLTDYHKDFFTRFKLLWKDY